MTPPPEAPSALPPQGGRAGRGTVQTDGFAPASARSVSAAGAEGGPAEPVPRRPLAGRAAGSRESWVGSGSEPRLRILLAPMEGLLDHSLRDVITRVGGIDRCVSEFIRITDQLLPARVFTRIVPELHNGSRTAAGVPVRPQLLGSDPACLADNAALLATLHPEGVDLNFGCPAKTVNRHRGGAVLLDEPELVWRIVRAVRRAVPAHLPVSAKMRLGTQDTSRLLDNAHAIADGGAQEVVVHARTKLHGYRPPAYWEHIAAVREAVAIDVVANGEVWTVDEAQRCLAVSGCSAIMLGRGIVSDPGLALALRGAAAPGWDVLQPLLTVYWQRVALHVEPRHRPGRLKQWLNLLRRRFAEGEQAYAELRTLTRPDDVEAWLAGLSRPARATADLPLHALAEAAALA
jgi:tRNA-dihydrouridine synthase C